MDKTAQDNARSLENEFLLKTILEKIQFQWKTIRKAFCDLNKEKSGCIMPEELRFYFKHWGLQVTEEQFKFLFNNFDVDKDGKISYKDFQISVGAEIHPAEGLYFRQDKKLTQTIDCCKHEKCWQSVSGFGSYCALHQKMHQDQAEVIFGKLFKKIGQKWHKFIKDIKEKALKEDPSQIFISNFGQILAKYGFKLSDKETENMLKSFPGIDEGVNRRINISRLYDQKYSQTMHKMYHKVDVHEN